jgi:Family of unknown function (DUF6161)
MSNEEYRLHYTQLPPVVFPAKDGMKRYLLDENRIWKSFLDHLKISLRAEISISQGRNGFSAHQLALALENLISSLDDSAKFNRATQPFDTSSILPPPSESLEGQLILGLFEAGMTSEAVAVYVTFIVTGRNARYNVNDEIANLVQKGKPLLDAAPIVKALPYSRISSSKMAGTVRAAENHVQSLANEIVAAQKSNAAHGVAFQAQLEEQKNEAKRIQEILLRLNQRRDRKHRLWMAAANQLVAEKFEEARKNTRIFKLNSGRAEQARVAEFERLKALFETHLRFRAPVQLWEAREKQHNKNSENAMKRFIFVGGLTVFFGISVPFFFGDYIANSFTQVICAAPAAVKSIAQDCERVFSAKGPVTITGLLLVMSLLMWMTRLQYRIHLSERHLALDASEKKAFAETYLAMKQGNDVGKDNEAIVLASLFRPTQDGIIRDDESSVDISAAAIMAKQFSRSGQT